MIGSLKAAGQAEQVSLKHLVGNGGSCAQMWPEWADVECWWVQENPTVAQWQTKNRSSGPDFWIIWPLNTDILACAVAEQKPGSVISCQAEITRSCFIRNMQTTAVTAEKSISYWLSCQDLDDEVTTTDVYTLNMRLPSCPHRKNGHVGPLSPLVATVIIIKVKEEVRCGRWAAKSA